MRKFAWRESLCIRFGTRTPAALLSADRGRFLAPESQRSEHHALDLQSRDTGGKGAPMAALSFRWYSGPIRVSCFGAGSFGLRSGFSVKLRPGPMRRTWERRWSQRLLPKLTSVLSYLSVPTAFFQQSHERRHPWDVVGNAAGFVAGLVARLRRPFSRLSARQPEASLIAATESSLKGSAQEA
jgi:hypothetical protein